MKLNLQNSFANAIWQHINLHCYHMVPDEQRCKAIHILTDKICHSVSAKFTQQGNELQQQSQVSDRCQMC